MKLTGEVVLPLGSPDDAVSTMEAVEPYVEEVHSLVLVYVVEKAGGAPDKASVEQREEYAEEIFEAAHETLSEGVETETRILYDESISDAIFGLCDDIDASSVVILPRKKSGLLGILVGGRMRSFVEENNVPVVILPSDN